MFISKPYINLTMEAQGKADLYFHAYFWEQYLKACNGGSPGKKKGKADDLSSGSVSLSKFQFM